MASGKERDEVWREWQALVNMAADELDAWLDTDESNSVGDAETGESTGHASGRQILKILQTEKAAITDAQWDHMAKVVGYVKRHCAQGGPETGVEDSNWRYSLMNWGHDPLKDDGCAG